MQKQNISSVGKRGFTLVELSVVIALLAILVTMTVTFTMAMNGFVDVNRAEYDYLEEHSKLKEEISNWITENDVQGNNFSDTVDKDISVLEVHINEERKTAKFENGILDLNGREIKGFDSIASVTFDTIGGELIKCTTSTTSGKSQTFVVWMRFAEIGGGA